MDWINTKWAELKAWAKTVLDHPLTQYIIVRAKQQSTWRGIAAILATFGIVVADSTVDLWFTTVIGLLGVVAMFTNSPMLPPGVDPKEVKAAIEELRKQAEEKA